MEFIDQTGHGLRLTAPPRRIVSLVPSQTELLFGLGLGGSVAGVTRYCVAPEEGVRRCRIVGGTKKVDLEAVDALRPELILGNREENTRADIAALRERYPVWTSDVADLDDALGMIAAVGEMTGRRAEAGTMAARIRERFDALETFPELRSAYLIWKRPLMAAAAGSFIDAMLRRGGFANLFAERRRYPEVVEEELEGAELLLLSSEPYPFGEKDAQAFRRARPGRRTLLVDGSLFSWYGSRLLRVPDYLRRLRAEIARG